MEESLIENIFTSGEAALKSLQKNIYGKNFFHLGPARDNSLFAGFEKNKRELDIADFILCTGFLEGNDDSLSFYESLLKDYTHLKMVCTNPDLVVHRGEKKEYCAGTIAKIFDGLGGHVIYFGKPYPDIYNFCIQKNERVLAIGDNIRTDIKGANNLNIDCIFISEGVHRKEFNNFSELNKLLEKYNVKANFFQKELTW